MEAAAAASAGEGAGAEASKDTWHTCLKPSDGIFVVEVPDYLGEAAREAAIVKAMVEQTLVGGMRQVLVLTDIDVSKLPTKMEAGVREYCNENVLFPAIGDLCELSIDIFLPTNAEAIAAYRIRPKTCLIMDELSTRRGLLLGIFQRVMLDHSDNTTVMLVPRTSMKELVDDLIKDDKWHRNIKDPRMMKLIDMRGCYQEFAHVVCESRSRFTVHYKCEADLHYPGLPQAYIALMCRRVLCDSADQDFIRLIQHVMGILRTDYMKLDSPEQRARGIALLDVLMPPRPAGDGEGESDE